MKKIFSYFFPVTKKIPTDFNGELELTYYNGVKMLNSEHANYSYDSLQRLLKFGLTKIDLLQVKTILLLGLGGGSVIKTLVNDFNFNGKITSVELDKVIIQIAKTEFQIKQGANLDIIHADAAKYVTQTLNKFDLIIVDLFIDDLVPEIFFSNKFWEQITGIVNDSGYFIFNASATGISKNVLAPLTSLLEKFFFLQQFDRVENTNTLLVGKKL